MILNCPPAASLVAIPQPNCAFKFDQVVRMTFRRRQPIAAPLFTTLAEIQTLQKWHDYMNAADGKKIVVSPLFAGMVIPSSEALTTGGNDNSTINGVPEYNGEGSVTVTGSFKNLPPATKRALDALAQESLAGSTGASMLEVDLFNRDGYGFAINPKTGAGAATTIYRGIPIYNYRLGSVGSEGLNAPNINPFSFSLPGDWADYLVSYKPNFDPLVDLNVATAAIVIPASYNSTIPFNITPTPATVAGVTAITSGTNSAQKIRFNSKATSGLPINMKIIVAGVEETSVDTFASYVGDVFEYTNKLGVVTTGVFAAGNVTPS